MATTYLKAHHISRGETIAQSMRDRFDYGQNPDKTEQGELIMAYECDPRTADAEFLLTKARYKVITGREQKRDADVLCYQIRQSFPPGEIDHREALKISYELAMRWTKGKHAFSSFPIPTGPTPIVISISIQPRWTAPENTGIFSAQAAPCVSSPTGYALSTVFPSFKIRS